MCLFESLKHPQQKPLLSTEGMESRESWEMMTLLKRLSHSQSSWNYRWRCLGAAAFVCMSMCTSWMVQWVEPIHMYAFTLWSRVKYQLCALAPCDQRPNIEEHLPFTYITCFPPSSHRQKQLKQLGHEDWLWLQWVVEGNEWTWRDPAPFWYKVKTNSLMRSLLGDIVWQLTVTFIQYSP